MSGIPHKNVSTVRSILVDATSLTPLPSSQLINSYSIKHDGHCMKKIRNDAERVDFSPRLFWHRFTIIKDSNCKMEYSKIFILKLITDFVYPCELLPLYVSEKGNKFIFLARNCLNAIIKLCEANLLLPNSLEPFFPFTIVIIKDIKTINQIPVINIEPNIIEVLEKRESRGLIDLSGFHEDKDLREFCPLFQPKVLLYVLSLTSKLENQDLKITKIVLCNNDIRNLPNLESFRDRQFTSIDLGHNMIQRIEDIVPLKDLPRLQWVRLEGNPLCSHFDNGTTYFLYVKTICKNLQTLDTKRLCEDGWYKKHRTFLCDSEGFDFANQFVEQYYTYFDEEDRHSIGLFYNEDAMFSITHHSASKLYPKGHELLNIFIYRDRNILLTGSQHVNFLHVGRDSIQQQFRRVIPSIRHHQHSFYVDLMQYTKTRAVISVTGVFKYNPINFLQDSQLCGFTRTFVLISKDSIEWLITNDLWHIYHPYKYKSSLPPWPEVKNPCSFPLPQKNVESHIEALTHTFKNVTGMTYDHSYKFLRRNNWNLELALKVFIDEHINDEIPDEAFSIERSDENRVEEDHSEETVQIEDDNLSSISRLLISKPSFEAAKKVDKTSNFLRSNELPFFICFLDWNRKYVVWTFMAPARKKIHKQGTSRLESVVED